jgi:hypothetical protein
MKWFLAMLVGIAPMVLAQPIKVAKISIDGDESTALTFKYKSPNADTNGPYSSTIFMQNLTSCDLTVVAQLELPDDQVQLSIEPDRFDVSAYQMQKQMFTFKVPGDENLATSGFLELSPQIKPSKSCGRTPALRSVTVPFSYQQTLTPPFPQNYMTGILWFSFVTVFVSATAAFIIASARKLDRRALLSNPNDDGKTGWGSLSGLVLAGGNVSGTIIASFVGSLTDVSRLIILAGVTAIPILLASPLYRAFHQLLPENDRVKWKLKEGVVTANTFAFLASSFLTLLGITSQLFVLRAILMKINFATDLTDASGSTFLVENVPLLAALVTFVYSIFYICQTVITTSLPGEKEKPEDVHTRYQRAGLAELPKDEAKKSDGTEEEVATVGEAEITSTQKQIMDLLKNSKFTPKERKTLLKNVVVAEGVRSGANTTKGSKVSVVLSQPTTPLQRPRRRWFYF